MRKSLPRNRPRQLRASIICRRFRGAGLILRPGTTEWGEIASFVAIKKLEAMLFHEFISLRELKILAHHFAH
jgi:hypothetical protein